MPISSACLTACASLDEIRSLKRDFDAAFDAAISSKYADDVKAAQDSKLTLIAKLEALRSTVYIAEAEHRFDLKRQYKTEVELLVKTGLVQTKKERDASGAEHEILFMEGIDDKEYPIPSYLEIVSRLSEKRELLRTKADQGFTKLLLVPFGMSLDEMIEKFGQYLLVYKEAYDKAHEHKEDDMSETFALDRNKPVWMWDDSYNGADKEGTLVYDPTSFDANHGGRTKTQILEQAKASQESPSAWRILLLQGANDGKGFRNIPRFLHGKREGTELRRSGVEAGKSPREYLEDQLHANNNTNSPYYGESGMTPEEWIALFMTHLEETGKTMDDFQKGLNDSQKAEDSASYLTGACFSVTNYVPWVGWRRDARSAYFNSEGPGVRDTLLGVRSEVRV